MGQSQSSPKAVSAEKTVITKKPTHNWSDSTNQVFDTLYESNPKADTSIQEIDEKYQGVYYESFPEEKVETFVSTSNPVYDNLLKVTKTTTTDIPKGIAWEKNYFMTDGWSKFSWENFLGLIAFSSMERKASYGNENLNELSSTTHMTIKTKPIINESFYSYINKRQDINKPCLEYTLFYGEWDKYNPIASQLYYRQYPLSQRLNESGFGCYIGNLLQKPISFDMMCVQNEIKSNFTIFSSQTCPQNINSKNQIWYQAVIVPFVSGPLFDVYDGNEKYFQLKRNVNSDIFISIFWMTWIMKKAGLAFRSKQYSDVTLFEQLMIEPSSKPQPKIFYKNPYNTNTYLVAKNVPKLFCLLNGVQNVSSGSMIEMNKLKELKKTFGESFPGFFNDSKILSTQEMFEALSSAEKPTADDLVYTDDLINQDTFLFVQK